ncbi:flagellar rod assembly protein/muramidase FlgJ [Chromobacterium haemolyticum]|nr:flagellar assembly peptidoglycan hydrolase FlgJ [Chromobacterium haemolyticum]MDH0342758.1 flagellar assembly peptidoglycan hydrolase FlgJ [Chromobacterium haemolyticum]OQS36752.1 flagellar rod assembly protein/muramidase FlgJ [Chromobacterium haemolyticum]BBH13473.1 flagellar rod assembly protein/muramidase FlgJ [Chromobacterium haemolyticum]
MTIQSINAGAMSANDLLNRQLAVDPSQLNELRAQAIKDPKGAARQVASQFEALLMNTLLKNMRETKFDPEGESNDLNTYQGLYDQQLTQALSSNGGLGLGDMLYRQIAKQSNFDPDDKSAHTIYAASGPQLAARPTGGSKALLAYQEAQQTASAGLTLTAPAAHAKAETAGRGGSRDFAAEMLPHARTAAAQLGVAPEAVVAHAALESGWGKRAIRHPDGSNSHNLFGIKASGDWQGRTVSVMTTEYEGGVAQKRVEKFRAYGSYAEAFSDYARLLKDSPRYKSALNQGQNMYGFAHALQSGGYATDPRYARKLVDVAATLAQQTTRS